MPRQNISSGSPWEPVVGYSRAVRIGNIVRVAGTTATDEAGQVIGPGDSYTQARAIFEKIGRALGEAGASFEDVIATRMYVTDITRWEDIARAHSEVFHSIRPAATMVQVQALISPGLLVEIEVEAVLDYEG